MCERLGMMLAALQLTKVDKVEDTEKVDNALDEPNSLLPINIWMCETYQTFN
ncbi:protein NRT1/ PTR FAMILY 5.4-like isoform X1, partial [Sesbania bispinosa]